MSDGPSDFCRAPFQIEHSAFHSNGTRLIPAECFATLRQHYPACIKAAGEGSREKQTYSLHRPISVAAFQRCGGFATDGGDGKAAEVLNKFMRRVVEAVADKLKVPRNFELRVLDCHVLPVN